MIAQIFIIVAALVFAILTRGGAVVIELIFNLNITEGGVSAALLLYARATSSVLLMFSFAMSTPIPHMARALNTLRLPDVFVEMTVLIYRYTFLLLESAERMHLAAECRFGYSGVKRRMKTTAKLAVGVFLRSMDTAERGQITLQCRNYRGEFKSLSDYEKKSKMPTVLCLAIVSAAVIFFFALRYEVLPI
jgi:cobalt ECF transporter T component CbiQ